MEITSIGIMMAIGLGDRLGDGCGDGKAYTKGRAQN